MELDIDIRAFDAILKPLKHVPSEMRNALRGTLQRSGRHLASRLSAEIKSESYLKSGDIKSSIGKPLLSDSMNNLHVDVRVADRKLPLDYFRLMPGRVTARKGMRSSMWAAPAYQIGPREPKVTMEAESGYSKPFITRFKNGKLLLMHKKGTKWVRIRKYAVQYFAAFTRVEEAVFSDTRQFFKNRLEHEVDFRLGRLLK